MSVDAGAAGPPAPSRSGPGTVEVTVARSDPRAQRTFAVESSDARVVLDLLVAIQERHDPSLGFRYSCRIAACGTCTVRVDGRPVLACQAIVDRGRTSMSVEPLGGLPVVRDLIVDLTPFHDRWARVAPSFMPGADDAGQAAIPPDAPERAIIDPNLDCITCGACYAACGLASSDSLFLGPAALNRAMVLAADSRDGAAARRITMAAGDTGIDGCHGIGACTVVCPKGLDPAGSIRRLRRRRLGLP